MGCHAEGRVNIRVRGYEGAQARMQELQSRLQSVGGGSKPIQDSSPAPMPPSEFASLQGQIGRAKTGGFEPLDPMRMGAGLNPMAGDPAQAEITARVEAAAQQAGIDPALFRALVAQESGFNPRAVSSAGAMGLSQLMPKTAASLGVTDPFDVEQNLRGGAQYLAQMLRQFGGDTRLALAAYNAGPGAVRRAGGIPPIAETQNYVKRVMERWQTGGTE